MERENGVIKRASSRGGGVCVGGGDNGSGTFSITSTPTSSTAASSNTITTRRHQEERFYEDASQRSFSRTCVLGCLVNKLALCRFPVHDPKRCHNWLKFFNITKDRVEKLGGLNNLRVCMKHFNQKQQMAKTRIKTTPTRLQKDALAQAATTPAAATTIKPGTTIILETSKYNNSNNSKAQDLKRQAAANGLQLTRTPNSNMNSNPNGNSSTIIVAAPKRTTSVSSATSTLSRTSDTPSDLDGVTIKPIPPAPSTPPMPPALIPIISTIQLKPCATSSSASASASANVSTIIPNNTNGFINKLCSNGKRKIYLITEKSEINSPSTPDTLNVNTNISTGISKRKMYLIMEDQNLNNGSGNSNIINNTNSSSDIQSNGNGLATKVNISQAPTENKRKKLTLFADSETELTTHKFEQILPEILNRIKSQQSVSTQINGNNNNNNIDNNIINELDCGSIGGRGTGNNIIDIGAEIKLVEQPKPRDEVKPPITLPPKKNRTKITQNAIYDDAVINNVPVIVSNARRTIVNVTSAEPTSVLSPNNRSAGTGFGFGCAGDGDGFGDGTTICNKWEQIYNDKQINLSSDFLFLMKMLPKLESIPEPHKQQVKSCIETFINQSASRCTNQGLY